MKNAISVMFLCIMLSNCTQNFISYIKTDSRKPICNIYDILVESGLVYSPDKLQQSSPVTYPYITGTLSSQNSPINIQHHTLAVRQNTQIDINVNTKNYLIASPYYSSEGIVYDANLSKPKQGMFVFFIAYNPGTIKIRIYSPKGILQTEEIWHIEIVPETTS